MFGVSTKETCFWFKFTYIEHPYNQAMQELTIRGFESITAIGKLANQELFASNPTSLSVTRFTRDGGYRIERIENQQPLPLDNNED